jgi:hypothetical protein
MKMNFPSAISAHLMPVAICLSLLITLGAVTATGQSKEKKEYRLENEKLHFSIVVTDSQIVSDRLEVTRDWARENGNRVGAVVETDADFSVDLMYTDWQAPGKANNADNELLLTKKDFILIDAQTVPLPDGGQSVVLTFRGNETTLLARITYRLGKDDFIVRRNLALMDSSFGHHFLRRIAPRRGEVKQITSVIKKGEFGQPVAFLVRDGGGFFGLEYPASQNSMQSSGSISASLSCSQEMGMLIGKEWVESEWVVEAVTPDSRVKKWFFTYLDGIRVAPLKPYTLYNSWYDLRSPEYPKVPKENFMSEQSSMKMINLLRKNMIEKHGIALDAFVLDDGWDVYESDWVLRKDQFPKGMKPLTEELKKTKTNLGIWFGPTGGYSFRKKRLAWMKLHGYEVVGDQMCVAGEKYGALLKKRVTDFVKHDGVGYFKWDGIQFSCSEPGHGHPVDIYSRRAVLERVRELGAAVREKNPEMFLNITSGTWLSPWWVKYANTIWMQGGDYGYADVPSISQRDAAITYRDFMLYDDLHTKDLWFPVANLMTHGIIKGKLELLGSPEEPLDKFTDDALLYVARGVAMYELYISPDILTEGEWDALSASLAWARDRFSVLSASTEMIGGNPQEREAYGYTHFKGNRGVIAVRNPFVQTATLNIQLESAQGLDAGATDLVLERVYPTRWISPRLYRAEDMVRIELEAYETAVYELYPLEEATEPLPAGVVFDVVAGPQHQYTVRYHTASPDARILNPGMVASVTTGTGTSPASRFAFRVDRTPQVVTNNVFKAGTDGSSFTMRGELSETAIDGSLAILLTPDKAVGSGPKPDITVTINGTAVPAKMEEQEGRSQWYLVPVSAGKFEATVQIRAGKGESSWRGSASAWIFARQRQVVAEATLSLNTAVPVRPLPPHPWNPEEVRKTVSFGETKISAGVK